jgi:hypothetical protein
MMIIMSQQQKSNEHTLEENPKSLSFNKQMHTSSIVPSLLFPSKTIFSPT